MAEVGYEDGMHTHDEAEVHTEDDNAAMMPDDGQNRYQASVHDPETEPSYLGGGSDGTGELTRPGPIEFDPRREREHEERITPFDRNRRRARVTGGYELEYAPEERKRDASVVSQLEKHLRGRERVEEQLRKHNEEAIHSRTREAAILNLEQLIELPGKLSEHARERLFRGAFEHPQHQGRIRELATALRDIKETGRGTITLRQCRELYTRYGETLDYIERCMQTPKATATIESLAASQEDNERIAHSVEETGRRVEASKGNLRTKAFST